MGRVVYMRHKLLYTFALALTAVFLLPGTAYSAYKPLEILGAARKLYNQGMSNCNVNDIRTAGDQYETLYHRLKDNVDGIGAQFPHLKPMAAYKRAWCYFRLAEMEGSLSHLDSACEWFDLVDRNAKDSLGLYAAYMTGEAKWRKAVYSKFNLLCRDSLSLDDVTDLHQTLTSAKENYQSVLTALDKQVVPLCVTTGLRNKDMAFEIAMLYLAGGNNDMAAQYLDTLKYLPLDTILSGDDANAIRPILTYTEAMRLYIRYLISPDDVTKALLDKQLANLGIDSLFRNAGIAQVEDELDEAVSHYDKAASDAQLVEVYYWLGFLELILSRDADGLRKSMTDFTRFIDAIEAMSSPGIRLQRLVAKAKHKVKLLGIVLNPNISNDDYESLGRDEIKFLIRVAASIPGQTGTRPIKRLDKFLSEYKPSTQPSDPTTINYPPCVAGIKTPLTEEETKFYNGVARSLAAERITQPTLRRQTFAQAASILEEVSGNYAIEARYVRALSLYRADKLSEAEDIARGLIRDHRSLRAAYLLALCLKKLNDSEKSHIACDIMEIVLQRIDDSEVPSNYRIFKTNAISFLNQCSTSVSYNIPGINNLACPETLSVDTTGPEPELVFYETLADQELVKKRFADECLNELMIYGLPKRSLYPTSRSCLVGRAFSNPFPIPDGVQFDSTWKGFVKFADDSECGFSMIDGCEAFNFVADTSLGAKWNDSSACYGIPNEIQLSDEILVIVRDSDHYTTYFNYVSDEAGHIQITIPLAKKVKYKSSSTVDCPEQLSCTYNEFSRNMVITQEPPPSSLEEDFTSDVHLRDFAFDPKNNRFLAVDRRQGKAILAYGMNGERTSIQLNFGDNPGFSLDRPEGIAVDAAGSVYIADWGNDRVVIFQPDARGTGYRYYEHFGGHGINDKPNTGANAKFVYPTRIIIEEDETGIDCIGQYGESLTRDTHILVADKYGIHKFDTHGHYLDSPVNAANSDISNAEYYGFSIKGYGGNSKLYVADRKTGKILQFIP